MYGRLLNWYRMQACVLNVCRMNLLGSLNKSSSPNFKMPFQLKVILHGRKKELFLSSGWKEREDEQQFRWSH